MTQSALVKIGVPPEQADGQRFVRRVRQLLEQRDAYFARGDADFRARMKALMDEYEVPHATTAAAPVTSESVAAV